MATVIDELVSYILETRFEDFGEEVVEDAKKRIIDVAGCAIGGANAPGISIMLDLLRGWGGKKEASIIAHGDGVPAHNAAMMNSIMARSYDYEATGPSPTGEFSNKTVGHNCCTTEPAALSIAEQKGSNGKEIITSVILGGDIAVRIAVAQDGDPERGFDVTGPVAALGATAVAGRLLGLNQNQMVNAFGIVVDTIAGSFKGINDGVHAFKLHGALAARNAIIAAEMASKGFTGIKDPLLGRGGYFAMYAKSSHPEYATKDLGKVFYSKGRHKIHPSCYGNHVAIDCALDILRQQDINCDDIDEITLGLSLSAYRSNLNEPFELGDSQQKALFNLPYGVANVLMRKSVKMEHYTDEFIQDPRVVNLSKKVKVVSTIKPDYSKAIDLKVKLKGGKVLSAHSDQPRGFEDTPLTKEEIRDKFRANVAFSKTVSAANAEKALAMLENLEEVNRINKIVKLLIA